MITGRYDLFKRRVQEADDEMLSLQMASQLRQYHKRVASDAIFTDITTNNAMTLYYGHERAQGRDTAGEFMERARIIWTEILYRAEEPNIGEASS